MMKWMILREKLEDFKYPNADTPTNSVCKYMRKEFRRGNSVGWCGKKNTEVKMKFQNFNFKIIGSVSKGNPMIVCRKMMILVKLLMEIIMMLLNSKAEEKQ